MRLPIHDAAQTVLGLEDAEAELLFYGEDLPGTRMRRCLWPSWTF